MSSIVNYVADGSTTEFQIPFTYISEAHVVVTIDGTATSAFTFLNSSTLQMNTAPSAGAKVQLQRTTPTGALVDFTDGSTLFETDLDLAHQQNRLIAEESKDIANVAKTTIDNNIADVNTVAAIAADVTNVASRGADVTSVADNMAEVLLADTNAVTATTKAAEAVVSANTASAQAVISTTKATESSASAAAALASQNAAQQARTDADTSEGFALAYRNSAQTAATTATTKASEASQSATTASSQAATATQKASEASTDAGIALAQAGVATTKAAAASTSESNALSYKDTALAASSASETARAASVVAKDASQVAQTASEAARDAASASETAAATSETNAATSASTATTQAGTATTKAGEAATSASNAASSASSAQASKDAALEALDSFDDRYLGQKTADPTVDNDGNALVSGALYFNTTDDIMKVYDGSLWVAAYASLSGAMFGANNLSDVASISASRTTLGLGTGDTPTFAGINTTGNATFGDNDKAIFGAGSDLQIYHDGSHSRLKETGTGKFYFDVSNSLFIRRNDTSALMASFETGIAKLYYDNALKLATTSTGIDVTGTVTADGLTASTSGNQVMLLDSTSGATTLQMRSVSGSVSNYLRSGIGGSANLRFETTGNVVRQKIDDNGDISFYEDTGTTAKFFWDASAESLGIGTSSPSSPLTIKSPTSGYDGGIRIITGSGTETSAIAMAGTSLYLSANAADDHLVIDSSGNVGIGTSSPSAKLTISDTGSSLFSPNAYIAGATADVMRLGFDSGGARTNIVSGRDSGTSGATNGYMAFETRQSGGGMTEAMRINSSGNLLVGTTSSDDSTDGLKVKSSGQKLTVTRNGAEPLVLNRRTSDGDILKFRKDNSTVGSIGAGGGTLLIDSGTAYSGLGFDGSVIYPRKARATANGTVDLGASSARFKDAHFSGTVNAANFNTTSDAILKTNVETLTGSLDAVKSLRGVSFDWIENGNSDVGVIAQEVEAVLPDVVSTNDQGIKSVKYGNMVALLIEAMKEQQAQIDELKAKLGE